MMFTHYIKTAIRNLRKYNLQSTISTVGLAVGFVCFTLSALWIRYELSYDSFHEDANLIYRVRVKDTRYDNGLAPITSYALAGYLKNTFPEIKAACSAQVWEEEMTINGKRVPLSYIRADSAFLNMFSVSIITGNKDVLQSNNQGLVITDVAVRKLFGSEDPLGKEVDRYGAKKTIDAVSTTWSKHSNLPFDIISTIDSYPELAIATCQTYIKFHKGTDITAFIEKLHKHKPDEKYVKTDQMVLTPLTALHYQKPDKVNTVKFNHILLFAVSGGLVVLCSLFNFLTLFISRIRMRGKELALRKVNGASNRSLLFLLSTELIITLLCSTLLGILLMEWALPKFLELSQMQNRDSSVYPDIFGYAGIVIGTSFLISLIPIHYFRRKTLHSTLQGENTGYGKSLFRRGSILLQLIISIGFIFCTSVLFKQIYFLSNTDMGMERKNVSTLKANKIPDILVLEQELKQLPLLEEVCAVRVSMFPQWSSSSQYVTEWEDKPESEEGVSVELISGNPEFLNFYNFTFIKGRPFVKSDDPNKCVIINETAWKKFGWNDPIGKKFDVDDRIVIGVIKDYYNQSPTIPSRPTVIYFGSNAPQEIVYKYRDGEKVNSEKQIQKLFAEKFPEAEFHLFYTDTIYAEFIKSEQYLLLLLGFVSGVCIIISIFGIYSLAALTAEEKRREIAIRKVNGASIRSILHLFFREYLSLLIIASVIAFPVGYIIMKPWLENYVKQTEVSAWLFIVIVLLVGAVIVQSVFSCIWKAAKANPAEVIKSE